MKKSLSTTVLLALPAVILVSCEQPARVVERPLGHNAAYPQIAAQTPDPSMQQSNGTDLLNQLQSSDPLNNTGLDPQAGNTPGNTTLGSLLGGNSGQGTTAGTNTPGNTISSGNGLTPPAPVVQTANIPTAWLDPGDPTVVRSPYDRSKKIRITRPDGTRHPSGTILWDPNYPKSEKKQFRVP